MTCASLVDERLDEPTQKSRRDAARGHLWGGCRARTVGPLRRLGEVEGGHDGDGAACGEQAAEGEGAHHLERWGGRNRVGGCSDSIQP